MTPNRSEALALGARPGEGQGPWRLDQRMRVGPAWWIKSVAGDERQIWDELHLGREIYRIAQPRHLGPDPRGTGCALASALAVFIARGWGPLSEASPVWHWQDGAWVFKPDWSPSLAADLGPVLAASQWLAKVRKSPVLHGETYFLPRLAPAQE